MDASLAHLFHRGGLGNPFGALAASSSSRPFGLAENITHGMPFMATQGFSVPFIPIDEIARLSLACPAADGVSLGRPYFLNCFKQRTEIHLCQHNFNVAMAADSPRNCNIRPPESRNTSQSHVPIGARPDVLPRRARCSA